MRMSRFPLFFVRLTVGLVLLFFILRPLDLSKVVELLSHIDLRWGGTALGIILALRILMAIRWQYILVAHNVGTSIKDMIRITFISSSAGPLLPGGIGADLVRGYQVTREYGQFGKVAATIFVDRAIGLYSMLFVAFIGSLYAKLYKEYVGLVVFLLLAQIALLGIWMLIVRFRNVILTLVNSGEARGRWIRKLWTFLSVLTDLKAIRPVFPLLFALSISVQLARCILFWCVYQSLGSVPSFIYYVMFIPLVYVAVLVPVSIGGLGVREGVLVYFFTGLGIPAEMSVSAGLLSHVLQIAALAPGIILLVFWKRAQGNLRLPPGS